MASLPMRRLLFASICCAIVLLSAGCSEEPDSPEAEIRRYIERGVEAAEARSLGDLSDMVHDQYRDQKGYTKKKLGGVLRLYFLRHKNIHLFTRIDEITLYGDSEADVSLHVAMAGSVISDIDAVARLAARLYRFELHLIKEDDWLLRDANWSNASLSDLQ